MKIRFSPVSTIAKFFYMSGFVFLIYAWISFFWENKENNVTELQQIFIVGAILVSIGSVINIYQQIIKPAQKNNKKET